MVSLCHLLLSFFVLGNALLERDPSYYQNVGLVKQSFFHADSIILASSNVVASVNVHTSEIGTSDYSSTFSPALEWRRVLDEELVTLRYTGEGQLALLSVVPERSLVSLRLFSLSGDLVFEKLYENKKVRKDDDGYWSLDAMFLPDNKLALLLDNSIFIFLTKKTGTEVVGALLSETALPGAKCGEKKSSGTLYNSLYFQGDISKLYAVGYSHHCNEIVVSRTTIGDKKISFDLSSFKYVLPSSTSRWYHSCGFSEDALLCTTQNSDVGQSLLVFRLLSSTFSAIDLESDTEVKKALSEASEKIPLSSLQASIHVIGSQLFYLSFKGRVTSTAGGKETIVAVTSKTPSGYEEVLTASFLFSLDGTGINSVGGNGQLVTASEFHTVGHAQKALAAYRDRQGNFGLFTIEKFFNKPPVFAPIILPKVGRPLDTTWEAEKAWYQPENGRVLLQGKDASLHLLSGDPNPQVLWSREEGLSRVTASLFVDFPLEKPGTATDSEHRRDHFGFRKLVLSVTDVCAFLSVSLTNQTGNIFGLHTVKGTLLWSRHYPGLAFEKLFLTKRSVDEEDQTEAIAYGFASLTQSWWRVHFNPINGHELSAPHQLSYLPVKFVHLPEVESHPYPSPAESKNVLHPPHTTVVITADIKGRLHTFPETSEAVQYVATYPHPIYFYLHDLSEGFISGYAIDMHEEASDIPKKLSSTLLWKKVYAPAENAKRVITSIAKANGQTTTTNVFTTENNGYSKLGEELLVVTHTKISTHGPGRVTSDNGVLWKYLNPHTLVVGTSTRTFSGSQPDNSDKKDNNIYIYLIDIVTGRLLTSQVQKHAYPPLHVLSSDNYIIYDYWSAKAHATQVTVMDLYWNIPGWERTTFSSYSQLTQFRRTGSNEFQLRQKQPFTVTSQTYTSPSAITSLAVTVTSHGITNPQLLFGLEAGNVLQLDRRLVDSRRPVRLDFKPTQEDMKEGLRPYSAFLELSPLRFISYNRTVAELRHIDTVPTQLESTSLVLCKGLDLFYTAVTGGSTYDRLDPDFNSSLLMAVCVIVGVLTLITNHFHKKQLLVSAWK